jgi:hypothetical protein
MDVMMSSTRVGLNVNPHPTLVPNINKYHPHISKMKMKIESLCSTYRTGRKTTATPVQTLTEPEHPRKWRRLGFSDTMQMKMVRLSAPSTGRFYPQNNISVTHFFWSWSRPQESNAAG